MLHDLGMSALGVLLRLVRLTAWGLGVRGFGFRVLGAYGLGFRNLGSSK